MIKDFIISSIILKEGDFFRLFSKSGEYYFVYCKNGKIIFEKMWQ